MIAVAEIMANEMGVLPHVRDEFLNRMSAHMNVGFVQYTSWQTKSLEPMTEIQEILSRMHSQDTAGCPTPKNLAATWLAGITAVIIAVVW